MLTHLFSPGKIGKLEIKNRIVMPPMLVGMGTEDGFISDQMIAYYEERAKGGPGLEMIESIGFRPGGVGRCFRFYADAGEDKYVPRMTRLAEAIKKNSVRLGAQLGDGGRETRRQLTGEQPIAPSAIATRKREVPRELNKDDIKHLVDLVAQAAMRFKKAGFDLVEIHAAHVYLFAQFLSAAINKRTDEYGGSIENRTRIIRETIAAIKQTAGQDFPVSVRYNLVEAGLADGMTIEQAVEIAKWLEKAGADAISCSAGSPHYELTTASFYLPPGYLMPYVEQIKNAVKIPVLAVGRLSPTMGDEIIKNGKADFISIGRNMIVDPQLPNKAREGRLEDIAPCIACMNCSNRAVLRDNPTTCTVNAAVGLEREFEVRKAAKAKNIAIIGAGPAGMEAARIAATRGHKVTLHEKSVKIGGSLLLQAAPPCKDSILKLVNYFNIQLSKLNVKTELGKEATAAAVVKQKPDAVIIATGAHAQCKTVSADGSVVMAETLFAGGGKLGKTAIVVGDDRTALEAADFISEKGVRTTLVSHLVPRAMAAGMLQSMKDQLFERLAHKKVTLVNAVDFGAITPKGMNVVEKDYATTKAIEGDTLVFTDMAAIDADLVSTLRKSVPEVFIIGDCVKKQEHQDAIFDGSRVGRLV